MQRKAGNIWAKIESRVDESKDLKVKVDKTVCDSDLT